MSIARVALFAAIVQTVVANKRNYTVSTCTQDIDCRQFTDAKAVCIAGACECSDREDSSDYCNRYVRNPEDYEHIHFILSFDFPCDAFFGSDVLFSSVNDAARGVLRTWDMYVQDGVSIAFLCGLNAIVSGTVQIAKVAFVAEKLSSGVHSTLVGTQMQGSLTALSAVLGPPHNTCLSGGPVRKNMMLSGICVPVACAPEYYLTTNRTAQAPKCEELPDSDDDLSDGAIAGIVVGSVVGAVLIIAVVVFLVCSKKTPTQNFKSEQFV